LVIDHTYYRSPPARGRGLKQLFFRLVVSYGVVAPRAGARIETIVGWEVSDGRIQVAPRAGARIETPCRLSAGAIARDVAPRAGARIETGNDVPHGRTPHVAPRAGARIETQSGAPAQPCENSRPPRG